MERPPTRRRTAVIGSGAAGLTAAHILARAHHVTLHVVTQEWEKSMSVWCEGCGLEYAGARGLRGLLAQPRNIVHGRYCACWPRYRASTGPPTAFSRRALTTP